MANVVAAGKKHEKTVSVQRDRRPDAKPADFRPARLQQYTQEKVYSTTASKDFHLFYVGRDDVHNILKHILSRVSVSLYHTCSGTTGA